MADWLRSVPSATGVHHAATAVSPFHTVPLCGRLIYHSVDVPADLFEFNPTGGVRCCKTCVRLAAGSPSPERSAAE